jgi:glycerophosphoryl diester phosphodiesterase
METWTAPEPREITRSRSYAPRHSDRFAGVPDEVVDEGWGWIPALLSFSAAFVMLVGLAYAVVNPTPVWAGAVEATPDCGDLRIVSHGTSQKEAPFDTAQGIGVAGSLGVRTVEIDIRFNKSNFAIGTHEADLSGTTNAPAGTLVQNLWLPDVQKLSAADYAPWNTNPTYGGFNADGTPKTRLPYTYEILNAGRLANVALLLDVKVAPTPEQVTSFIGYMDRPEFVNGISKRLYWMGDPATIKAMRDVAGDRFTYVYLDNPADTMVRTGLDLNRVNADVYAIPNYRIEPNAVNYWHAFGKKSATWTTNSASYDTTAERGRVAAAGVDFLITDYAPQARQEICGVPAPAGAKVSK